LLDDADSSDDPARSRVLVGPPGGPLREVASCEAALTLPAVAVDGTRVAWSEGNCGVPVDEPRELGPGAVAIGAVDPAVPVRRAAVPDERAASGLALRGDTVVLGLLRPSLVTFYGGELRRVEGDALGPRLLGGGGELVEPAGVLPDGTAVAIRARFFDEDEPDCAVDLAAVPPAGSSAAPRRLRLGRCLVYDDDDEDQDGSFFFGLDGGFRGTVVAAGDRVVARTYARPGENDNEESDYEDRARPGQQIVSIAPDGGDRRILARGGGFRGPRDVFGGSGRLGWLQPRCGGNSELRTADPAGREDTRPVAGCRADFLTRRARLRGRSVRLRLRCPRGCKGRLVDRTVCGFDETARTFRFGPGTHTLRMPLSRRARRKGRALINIRAEHAPERFRRVRVTGRRAQKR
jgi:hypothetical protein